MIANTYFPHGPAPTSAVIAALIILVPLIVWLSLDKIKKNKK